ncbi:MAG: complex I NDUFA9 subunit family protein [Zoogloea sp.]|nr:complex I NDUFA9 subunit family protein [Zoogloea sp.]
MKIKNVLLVGGSGFVGSAVAARLVADGLNVLVPTRRLARVGKLAVLPTVEAVEADVHDPAVLRELMRGQDAVVNLVGILHSRSGQPYGPDFARAHVELPGRIVAACRDAGVRRLVHVSALRAAPEAPSEYLRSKADGEAAIRAAGSSPAWTILQPSVIFGPGDSFLNLFAGLLKHFPVLPLGGAGARFQPVYVEDVADVVLRSLKEADAIGKTFQVAGPTVYTLRELVEYVGAVSGHRRLVVPLPESLAMLQAALLERLPGPLMSRDNVRSMRVDNVADGAPQPFGRRPTPLEAIAPGYLGARHDSVRLPPMAKRGEHRDEW